MSTVTREGNNNTLIIRCNINCVVSNATPCHAALRAALCTVHCCCADSQVWIKILRCAQQLGAGVLFWHAQRLVNSGSMRLTGKSQYNYLVDRVERVAQAFFSYILTTLLLYLYVYTHSLQTNLPTRLQFALIYRHKGKKSRRA